MRPGYRVVFWEGGHVWWGEIALIRITFTTSIEGCMAHCSKLPEKRNLLVQSETDDTCMPSKLQLKVISIKKTEWTFSSFMTRASGFAYSWGWLLLWHAWEMTKPFYSLSNDILQTGFYKYFWSCVLISPPVHVLKAQEKCLNKYFALNALQDTNEPQAYEKFVKGKRKKKGWEGINDAQPAAFLPSSSRILVARLVLHVQITRTTSWVHCLSVCLR